MIEKEENRNLKKILVKHQKITQPILDTDDCIDQETKDIILNAFNEIFDIARDEWVEVKNNEVRNTKCSLCNKPNKLIYYIKNKINGKTLNVGSSCIQHFTNLNDEVTGESIEKLNRRILKSHESVNRRIDFNKTYPNIDKNIFEYRQALEKSPFLLPKDIYSAFSDKIKSIEEFCSEYLAGKIKKQLLTRLQRAIDECNLYIDSIIPTWLKLQENNEFVCTLEMKDWLEKHSLIHTISKIREQGSVLTIDTISDVSYPPFIQRHLSAFAYFGAN